jgi:hypothetical protein
MPDEVTAERVATVAAAARVPLAPGSAERIARATGSTISRFASEKVNIALETEPSTFVLVQRREIER